MPHLFGYGSLLNLSSASRSLRRQVRQDDLIPARLSGYRRTWTAPAAIQLLADPSRPVRNALFLDLSTADETCNGVVVQLSESELQEMDLREKEYERLQVSAETALGDVLAAAYVVPAAQKATEGAVLREYCRMIDDALANFDAAFRQEFWATTDPLPHDLLEGDYRFADAIQNRAAGR